MNTEWMPKGEMGNKIRDTVEMLKTTCEGDMTITLGGAHAKGLSDELSDIDIYMYFENPKPYETNKRIVEAFADDNVATVTPDHVSAEVGGYYVFNLKGTLVEVTTRFYANALKRINECLNGHFEILPTTWTINGYYTFTYASEISFVKPLWDTCNFIENTKKVIYPYPQKLKKRILEVFGEVMNQKPYSADYMNAIKRKDLFIVNYNVYSTLINMAQVIYALNETYFTGDKQIVRKLAALPYCPKKLLENFDFLMCYSSDTTKLERQRELLCELVQELNAKIEALSL